MIFVAADLHSIQLVKNTLDEFKELSGLSVNHSKSEVFCAAVPTVLQDQILSILQFRVGKLPVRYLGMPLIAGRLSYSDCIPLIEKITARINSWTARHLSFAGRLQLISSVLNSVQMFWSSIFILPKKVITAVKKQFNHFLWNGHAEGRGGSKVSWKQFCLPKQEGGLGLKRIEEWNKAAVLKHIWHLFTQAGSLWVAWVHDVLLKGKSFWAVRIPQSCSWGWRKLLKLRLEARDLLTHEVGDGSTIFLWHDRWHPNGVLYQTYGHRVVYDAASNLHAKVSSVIHNKEWCWCPARSEDMVDIQRKLSLIQIKESDKVVWALTATGIFNCAATWQHLRSKQIEVLGGSWFGFVKLFLNTVLLDGWLLKIDYLLRIDCCFGVLMLILYVNSADSTWKIETIYSSSALFRIESGNTLWLCV
jgi:hypothetical protein